MKIKKFPSIRGNYRCNHLDTGIYESIFVDPSYFSHPHYYLKNKSLAMVPAINNRDLARIVDYFPRDKKPIKIPPYL